MINFVKRIKLNMKIVSHSGVGLLWFFIVIFFFFLGGGVVVVVDFFLFFGVFYNFYY